MTAPPLAVVGTMSPPVPPRRAPRPILLGEKRERERRREKQREDEKRKIGQSEKTLQADFFDPSASLPLHFFVSDFEEQKKNFLLLFFVAGTLMSRLEFLLLL